LEKIGEGGMGEVYLAEDTSLNRKVALKFLPPRLLDDEIAHRRFLREAKSAVPGWIILISAISTRLARLTMGKTSFAWNMSKAKPSKKSC
jgi:serine/threonine protein kinase